MIAKVLSCSHVPTKQFSREEFESSKTEVSGGLNNHFGLRVSWTLPKGGGSDLEGVEGGKVDWWESILTKTFSEESSYCGKIHIT